MACNTITGHDKTNIVRMTTVKLDESDENFKVESVKVCRNCCCMVLDDYSAARAKRAINPKVNVPLFEESKIWVAR